VGSSSAPCVVQSFRLSAADLAQMMAHISGLFGEMRGHVDARLDALAAGLESQAARIGRLEGGAAHPPPP